MVVTTNVLYVTQHFSSLDIQGLGLAQSQLYIFIKPTMCEGKARLGLAHQLFCMSQKILYFHKPTFCEGEQG